MKKIAWLTLAFAFFLAVFLGARELCDTDPLERTPKRLPDVVGSHYGESITAKNIWDMEILDGMLYISTGDYGENSGKTPLFVYDISKNEWDTSYLTNDEALGDMRVIGDTLFIAGNDSCGDWSAANYYTVTNGEAALHAVLPKGAHCFDCVSYDGIYYFGIGTVSYTDSPVIAYDGEGYTAVPFFRDGESLFIDEGRDYLRAYNFFSHGGELYAFILSERNDGAAINFEIYKLTDAGFEFHSDLRGKGISLYTRDGKRIYQNIFKSVTAGDKTLITSGRLFSTSDLVSFEEIPPERCVVSDLYAYGDRVLVLSFSELGDGVFLNTVSEYKDGTFVDLCRFETSGAYALSFAYDGESFFFGTGGLSESSTPGAVFKIDLSI